MSLDGRVPVAVTLPADVVGALRIYDSSPLVSTIVDANAEEAGVPPEEYVRANAGDRITAPAATVGLAGADNAPEEPLRVALELTAEKVGGGDESR